MKRRILILSTHPEAAQCAQWLRARNPEIEVAEASDLPSLTAAIGEDGARTRLISWLSDVIAPAEVLERLGPEPYNIHPGTPDYPGAHPESFAIYERAALGGVTAHVMTADVDTGAIVYVNGFPIPEEIDRLALSDQIFDQAVRAFGLIAAFCAETDDPMRRLNIAWSGRRRTKQEFEALCAAPADADAAEIALRARACGASFEGATATAPSSA